MTVTTPPLPPDRVEPVDIQEEMQRSYIDYAMSVIVGRALPDVRDGLKPVHRRVLYAMYDSGYRPDRGYFKCARVVGEVMGVYHPHGDSAIYDALVRLAQPWSMRYPLIDGNGNFGSPGNDPAGAMRYCVTGETRVRLADGSCPQIASLVPDAAPNNDTPIDLKLVGRRGEAIPASVLFHSGYHPTLRLTTREGLSLAGTQNHPVLCLVDVLGVPMLLWRLLSEIRPRDRVVMYRGYNWELGAMDHAQARLAIVAGAFASEGFTNEWRAGFCNVDREFFDQVLEAYDLVVGGPRCVYSRTIRSGSTIYELDIQDLRCWRRTPLEEFIGCDSYHKRVPEFIWRGSRAVQRAFLQTLFEGDGSSSLLPRRTLQVSYSTVSRQLAADVQRLLIGFGVIAKQYRHPTGEIKVALTNARDVRLFAANVGFYGRKQQRLMDQIAASRTAGPLVGRSRDRIPLVAEYIRREANGTAADCRWLTRADLGTTARWERDHAEIFRHIADPEVRRVVEPLVDGSYYYAEVAQVEEDGTQPVYSVRVDSDDRAFLTDGFISHNTECRLDQLAMEMLREIDQETVNFAPNYDGRTQEPLVLPSRFPNLLVNGGSGIAVGMATNIPPHSLREVAAAVRWFLDHPDASPDELLDAAMARVSGPDFPTAALIVGRSGIEEAYRTGRGMVRMRAVVEVDEDRRGRTILVVTELPYQVNPDTLAERIAELVKDGKVGGIADISDESSQRTGQRLVITLKRDAVAKVVLNNLYKHTQLQDTFGVNMLALVDGVPRTLRLDEMVRYYVVHQVEVVVRRSQFQLRKKEERSHILRGYLKALDTLDEVIALIRGSDTVDTARSGLIQLLEIDEVQATAILDMQLRRLAALERQRIVDEYGQIQDEIAELEAILASPERQRRVVAEELDEVVGRYGDERRTLIVPHEGDMSVEDLIAREDVVVTITRGGYVKRTKTDLYRQQRRGGKGVQGAQLKQDDIVEHFFVTTTHDWILFFTNKGRVYRAKAYELPETTRAARGQHVANFLQFQPDERIAQVIDLRSYEQAPYLVLATRHGLVKKTPLTDFDSNRVGGIIAINLKENDELIGAALCAADDELLLVSRRAQSIRFRATDEALRPMGRVAAGVIGMRFGRGDELLAMEVVRSEDAEVLVATDGGFAKRTRIREYPLQGRGGKGVLTAKVVSTRGQLVGALVVQPDHQLFAITSNGGVIRTTAGEVRRAGRQTMGVRLISLESGVSVVAVARNAEPDSPDAVGVPS